MDKKEFSEIKNEIMHISEEIMTADKSVSRISGAVNRVWGKLEELEKIEESSKTPKYSPGTVEMARYAERTFGAKWVARDKNRIVAVYRGEPKEINGVWYPTDDVVHFAAKANFLEIKPGECEYLPDIT